MHRFLSRKKPLKCKAVLSCRPRALEKVEEVAAKRMSSLRRIHRVSVCVCVGASIRRKGKELYEKKNVAHIWNEGEKTLLLLQNVLIKI